MTAPTQAGRIVEALDAAHALMTDMFGGEDGRGVDG